VIRVQVSAASAVLRAGLEALVAASPGFALADHQGADVLLTALAPDELAPAQPIVLLGDPVWTAEHLRLGVRAILPPDATALEIQAAIEAAAAGLAVIDPAELEALLASPAPPPAVDGGPLTARELEVLRMLAEGAANKAIAWQLKISEHTVKFHVAQILAKLNAGTRTEAVTVGIRKGLILV
jgi:DNA-binding NarL/FixJ family response regulator